MKVSYLKKVLYTGLGTAFFEDGQSELGNKPSSTLVQLQQPIQNRFPFFTALWDYQNELEDVGEGIILDESFEDTSPNEKPGTMGNQESETNQRIESSGLGLKPKTNYNGEILSETLFTQASPFSVRKKEDVDLHCTTELKMGRINLKRKEKEVKEEVAEFQEIEDKVDIQKLKVKRVQPTEKERIPVVEVIKQESIQVPSSNQLSFQSSAFQFLSEDLPSQKSRKNKQLKQLKESTLQKRNSPEQVQTQTKNTKRTEPEKENMRILSDIAEQEETQESDILVKSVEIGQESAGHYDLTDHFFTESVKKGKTQVAKDAKQKREFPEKVRQKTQKPRTTEPEKEKQHIPLELEQQEKRQDSDTIKKATKVVQESIRQHDLKDSYFTESLKKSRIQMTTRTKQKGKAPEQIQPQSRKSRTAKPQKEKIRNLSNISKQEEAQELDNLVKVIKVVKEPKGQQNINANIFKKSSKKSEIQMVRDTQQKRKRPEQPEPQSRKPSIAKPQKEKIRIPSDIEEQEEAHELDAFVKAIKVVQKPIGQQNLNIRFFTASLKKSENQMAKIAKDVALVTKKLNEHINNEQSKPYKPVFLPKRPASHNLGDWSDLERNYIR